MNSMVSPFGPTAYMTRVPTLVPPAIGCGVPCAVHPNSAMRVRAASMSSTSKSKVGETRIVGSRRPRLSANIAVLQQLDRLTRNGDHRHPNCRSVCSGDLSQKFPAHLPRPFEGCSETAIQNRRASSSDPTENPTWSERRILKDVASVMETSIPPSISIEPNRAYELRFCSARIRPPPTISR